MITTRFVKMNWHPLRDNPLEYVDNIFLVSNYEDGARVTLTREGALDNYVIRIMQKEVLRSGDIMEACRTLNMYEVGMRVYGNATAPPPPLIP